MRQVIFASNMLGKKPEQGLIPLSLFLGNQESWRNSNYCFFTGATAAAGIFVCQFVSGLASISLFPGHFVGKHIRYLYREGSPIHSAHAHGQCRKSSGAAVATGYFFLRLHVPTNRRKGPDTNWYRQRAPTRAGGWLGVPHS